jgi:hypothetical protein
MTGPRPEPRRCGAEQHAGWREARADARPTSRRGREPRSSAPEHASSEPCIAPPAAPSALAARCTVPPDHPPSPSDRRPSPSDHRPSPSDHRPRSPDHRPRSPDHCSVSRTIVRSPGPAHRPRAPRTPSRRGGRAPAPIEHRPPPTSSAASVPTLLPADRSTAPRTAPCAPRSDAPSFRAGIRAAARRCRFRKNHATLGRNFYPYRSEGRRSAGWAGAAGSSFGRRR